MNPDDPLLGILVCPLDKGPLRLVLSGTDSDAARAPAGDASGGGSGDALYNPRLRRLYPIVNGVPHVRPASGAPVSDEEHERLTRQGGADPGPAADAPGAG
ncbi:Trm112 family protein [Streptomyces jumonjinensis]|uniref:Trm112 family protein n=1 Tax=Streptomyces jumonjinensis TaxID=1945 RepID=A0A646KJT5_STRJU|nr:Trm112 family protein [Streptomyces jumonjinensis]MQT02483.1 Trm112 family protein [Streptomyces jumonjinensis]